jgi:hypothetical protein
MNKTTTGHIDFPGYGSVVKFRNIRIKYLLEKELRKIKSL